MSAKRYRYTGKERDGETSLYYHGARYYAPWLGRWTAADPAGFVDGVNLYAYCKSQPIASNDPSGMERVECSNQAKSEPNPDNITHVVLYDSQFYEDGMNPLTPDEKRSYEQVSKEAAIRDAGLKGVPMERIVAIPLTKSENLGKELDKYKNLEDLTIQGHLIGDKVEWKTPEEPASDGSLRPKDMTRQTLSAEDVARLVEGRSKLTNVRAIVCDGGGKLDQNGKIQEDTLANSYAAKIAREIVSGREVTVTGAIGKTWLMWDAEMHGGENRYTALTIESRYKNKGGEFVNIPLVTGSYVSTPQQLPAWRHPRP